MDTKSDRADTLQTYMSFEVPSSELDAETLGITLIESGHLLNRIIYHLDPNLNLKLKVSPPRTGSFEIPVELLISCGYALALGTPYLSTLQKATEVFSEYIKVWQFFKGKDPGSKEKTLAIHGDNNTVVNVSNLTLNLYRKDSEARDATKRQFGRLNQDKEVGSFSVFDDKRNALVQVPRKEFPVLASRELSESEMAEEISVTNTAVVLKKPVFQDKPSSWEFVDSDGRKMSAKMADEAFLNRVKGGEKFAMGDRLEVRLQTQRKYDPNLKTHVIGKQEILEVLRHISRPEQMIFPRSENDEDSDQTNRD